MNIAKCQIQHFTQLLFGQEIKMVFLQNPTNTVTRPHEELLKTELYVTFQDSGVIQLVTYTIAARKAYFQESMLSALLVAYWGASGKWAPIGELVKLESNLGHTCA